ncbi:sulfatase-like hydrolase/transferase [bacterium]|nr:sulfatase-like hydrolase/transferase [bacterium]
MTPQEVPDHLERVYTTGGSGRSPCPRGPIVRVLIASGTLLVALLAGCGGGDAAREDLPEPDHSVLLIVIDTVGARYLGAHTPGLGNSPTIDRLAREGVHFTRCSSVAPWTQPVVASLITSRMPSEHGVRHIFDTLDREHTTLAEHLKRRGLRTGGVISHFVIGDELGYGQGFDTYDDEPVGDHRSITSAEVTDHAIAALERFGDAPYFLFVHYFDPHWYFNHHPQFDETSGYDGDLLPGMDIADLRAMRDELDAEDVAYLEGLYREEIAFTDHHVGRLLARLEELGRRDDTVVVLTADHGEEFMQHGWIGHTATLYEELIHVPLIVHAPGRYEARRIDERVSILDIMPTVLDLQGLAPDPGWRGVSLAPALRGEAIPPDRTLLAEVSYISPQGWPSGDGEVKRYYKTAAIEGDHKLVHDLVDGSWEFYHLATDPLEQDDLWNPDDPVQRALLEKLHAWQVDHTAGWTDELREELTIGEDAARRLRALGYVH